MIFFYLCTGLQNVSHFLSDGVIGNTSDFGSEESRFEPWSDNKERKLPDDFVREFFIFKDTLKQDFNVLEKIKEYTRGVVSESC